MSAPPTNRRCSGLAFWCGILLLTLVLYVGAYVSLIRSPHPDWGAKVYEGANHVMYEEPDYGGDPETNSFLRTHFLPIHLIDRTLHKDRWRA